MGRIVQRPIDDVIAQIKIDFKVENGVVYRNDGYIGSLNGDKYRQFKVNYGGYKHRVTVLAHHIAWLLYKGDWPKEEIDHENGNREDNSENNLRESNVYLQSVNKRKRRDGEYQLPVGVKRKGKYFEGYARVHGKKIYVGMSKDSDEIGRKVKEFILNEQSWKFGVDED